jgi:hypothetical protein
MKNLIKKLLEMLDAKVALAANYSAHLAMGGTA